jgi:hypothetical protein
MRRPPFTLVVFIAAGWAFGLLDSRIPMPPTSGAFWAGNLGAPWLVLPFLAGWTRPSRPWAPLAGALTCVAAMIGFFGPGSGWGPVSAAFVAGWIAAGALAGGLYGRFGFTWGRSHALLVGLALAVPFILEPWFWSLGFGYRRGSMAYWYSETAAGVALVVTVLLVRRQAARRGSAGVRAPA